MLRDSLWASDLCEMFLVIWLTLVRQGAINIFTDNKIQKQCGSYLQNERVRIGETKWAESQMTSEKKAIEEKNQTNPQTTRFWMILLL